MSLRGRLLRYVVEAKAEMPALERVPLLLAAIKGDEREVRELVTHHLLEHPFCCLALERLEAVN